MSETRSCFSASNPNLQIAWDSTTLGLLKTCPRKYQYVMIEGWEERDTLHLDFGLAYHSGLETFEKVVATDADIERALRLALKKALEVVAERNMRNDDTTKCVKTLMRAIIGYVDTYATQQHFTTHILANGKPAVELSFKVNLPILTPDGEPYILCGHLDRVVEFQDELYALDYKTSKWALAQSFFANFNPSNQMTLYIAAASVVLKQPVVGMIVDAVQLLVGGERFKRETIKKSDAALQEWLEDLGFWIKQAETYATANHYPMNDTACSMYGGCKYRDACAAHPKTRQHLLTVNCKKRKEKWNPLIER